MRKAVMYGAGNIGRGFIGKVFSEAGYEVVFIDVVPEVVEPESRPAISCSDGV
jgi:mannitol-1-phosphate 5-dehydrogenase